MDTPPKIRVLFADADNAFGVFARYSLEQLGHEITLASDGADLLARFIPERYDVVIAGIATPFVGGLEILRALQQRSPTTPVILLCDEECAHLAAQGQTEGAFAYFKKPLNDFDPLDEAIKQAHARRAAPAPIIPPTPITAPAPIIRPAPIAASAPDPFLASLLPLIEAISAQPLNTTLELLATTSAQISQATTACIFLTHAGGTQLFSAFGFADLETAKRDWSERGGDAFCARLLAQAAPLIEPLGDVTPALGMPLRANEQTLGALVMYPVERAALDTPRLAQLELLAAHGALAIEFARLREENLRLISSDPITGVLKREPFLEMADREFRRSWRYSQPITALIVDIDDLAAINAKHGHSIGNQVLVAVAQVCTHVVRSIDLVGRYESDTFAILLLMTESDGAQSVAERLRVEINALRLPSLASPFQITASVGVCSYPRSGCTSIFDLLSLAQEAQRAAHFRGANQIVYC